MGEDLVMLPRLVFFLLIIFSAPALVAEEKGSLEALRSWMEGFLARENIPGGAIAVTQSGRLIFAEGFGLANPATGERFAPDTLTRVGSLSKLVTAAAVMHLMERSGLKAEEPLFGPGGVFPEQPPSSADPRLDALILRDLFTMSTGWPAAADTSAAGTSLGILADRDASLPPDPGLITTAMLGRPLAENPGISYEYLNINPILLATLLKARTGKPYAAQVSESLLDPIGLRAPRVGRTRFADRQLGEAVYADDTAFPSLYPGDGVVPVAYCDGLLDFPLIAPTGGWVFSAVDFAQLFAHLSGRRRPVLLDASSRERFTSRPPGVTTWEDTTRFYGFHTEVFDDGAIWGKYGSMPGVAAWAAALPGDLGVVVVMNGRNGEAAEVFDPPFAGTTFDQDIREGIENALRDLPRISGDLFRTQFQPGRPALAGPARAAGTVGRSFSFTATTSPKKAMVSTSAVVPGLRMNPLTGELRGTPKAAGRFLVPVTATTLQGTATGMLEVLIGEPGTPVTSGEGFCPDAYQNVLRDGRLVDEVVLLGAHLTARPRPGLGARVLFVDPDGDLVVAELDGPGTLTIQLENAVTRPSARFPARGDAVITLAETSRDSTFRLFAVGAMNGSHPAAGDATASVRRLTVNAPAVGGLFLGNTRFHAVSDVTGIQAGGAQVETVMLGELEAAGSANPALLFGAAGRVIFSGSRMEQGNGSPVEVTGMSSAETFYGADANGRVRENQRPRARFTDNGRDITDKLFPPVP